MPPEGPPEHAVLAISPHLDDAVMAVGATLAAHAASAGPVTICTVLAGEPAGPLSDFASAFHLDCGLGADAVVHRRQEDRTAAALLGGEVLHLDFLDAIYRRQGTDWVIGSQNALFTPELPQEPGLGAAMADRLEAVIRDHGPAEVWAGAAIGEHIDHRLVRRAAEHACRRTGTRLRLWEGLPHHLGGEPALGDAPHMPLAPVRPAHMEQKLAAVAAYPSQIRMLWPPGGDWRAEFLAHSAKRMTTYGVRELLWPAPQFS